MHSPHSRWAGWLLACVLPPRDVEVTLGDLEEEYALRSHSYPSTRASRWYWSQVLRSMPVFLWTAVRRGGVLPTSAAAIGACVVQAIVELTTKSAISSWLAHDAQLPAIVTLVVTIPSLVLVSYLAARIRPGAATMFTAIILFAVLVQLVMKTSGNLAIWNQVAALVVGPAAAFAGGVLAVRNNSHSLHNRRSH